MDLVGGKLALNGGLRGAAAVRDDRCGMRDERERGPEPVTLVAERLAKATQATSRLRRMWFHAERTAESGNALSARAPAPTWR